MALWMRTASFWDTLNHTFPKAIERGSEQASQRVSTAEPAREARTTEQAIE